MSTHSKWRDSLECGEPIDCDYGAGILGAAIFQIEEDSERGRDSGRVDLPLGQPRCRSHEEQSSNASTSLTPSCGRVRCQMRKLEFAWARA